MRWIHSRTWRDAVLAASSADEYRARLKVRVKRRILERHRLEGLLQPLDEPVGVGPPAPRAAPRAAPKWLPLDALFALDEHRLRGRDTAEDRGGENGHGRRWDLPVRDFARPLVDLLPDAVGVGRFQVLQIPPEAFRSDGTFPPIERDPPEEERLYVLPEHRARSLGA